VRILMLGWEFPPFISGGLGTACYGLTKALDRRGHEVIFVLPKAVDRSHASHVKLVSPEGAPLSPAATPPLPHAGGAGARPAPAPLYAQRELALALGAVHYGLEGFTHTEFLGVPSWIRSTYTGARPVGGGRIIVVPGQPGHWTKVGEEWVYREVEGERAFDDPESQALRSAGVEPVADPQSGDAVPRAGADYSGDVIGESQRYARFVVRLCARERFDVIHAHDWMTYPAGVALARVTHRPLVCHIHSTEFDRSGEHVNQAIYDLERRGMHAAIRVIAVSMYTKSLCVRRYSVDPGKIEVVYNGIEQSIYQSVPEQRIGARDKIVLFLGRITMQKGPDYFVRAAKRVLEKMENVKFIVAGSGDMGRRMVELAAEMGIGHKVLFTGFLRGKDVERVFKMADCYVMPSVSEPFGIAPLEAISHDVPVIISKQSGVSEVLTHALKVDFWDIDEMANKILAVLRHPPLSRTLREHGQIEVRSLTWDGAAKKCEEVYEAAIRAMSERALVAV